MATETRIAVQITPKAASSPTWAFSHSSKIATETTGVCGLTSKTDMDSSLADSRKIKTQPPKKRRGQQAAKIIRRIEFNHDAPEAYAASSNSLCSCNKPEWV